MSCPINLPGKNEFEWAWGVLPFYLLHFIFWECGKGRISHPMKHWLGEPGRMSKATLEMNWSQAGEVSGGDLGEGKWSCVTGS